MKYMNDRTPRICASAPGPRTRRSSEDALWGGHIGILTCWSTLAKAGRSLTSSLTSWHVMYCIRRGRPVAARRLKVDSFCQIGNLDSSDAVYPLDHLTFSF